MQHHYLEITPPLQKPSSLPHSSPPQVLKISQSAAIVLERIITAFYSLFVNCLTPFQLRARFGPASAQLRATFGKTRLAADAGPKVV